jgi:hypothetical protein
VVEMLPYNWQWAGICELYRNIRCTAAAAQAACHASDWIAAAALRCTNCCILSTRVFLSSSRSVGDIHHVAWRANSMQWAAYASPNDKIYGSWTAAECGSK